MLNSIYKYKKIRILLIILLSFSFIYLNINNISNANSIIKTNQNDDLENLNFEFNQTNYFDFNDNDINQNSSLDIIYDNVNYVSDTILNSTHEYYSFIRNTPLIENNVIDFVDTCAFNPTPTGQTIKIDLQQYLSLEDTSTVNQHWIRHYISDSNYLYINFTFKIDSDDYIQINLRESDGGLRDIIAIVISETQIGNIIGGVPSYFYDDNFTIYTWLCVEAFAFNETFVFSFQNLDSIYIIPFAYSLTDGIDEIYVGSMIAFESLIIFKEFQIINYIDFISALIIFDFSNILDKNPSIFEHYTYIMLNIDGNITFSSVVSLFYLDDRVNTYQSTNWNDLSNNKTLFWYLSDFLDYIDDSIIILEFTDNINIEILKIFGYIYLKYCTMYGPISSAIYDVNKVSGLNSSYIENYASNKFSLNHFYSLDKKLYYRIDFIDNNKNYLHFDFKVSFESSYTKATFITFSSERNPSLISKSYLELIQSGAFGYQYNVFEINDIIIDNRIQLLYNDTITNFEFIKFNCSDLTDNAFTRQIVNGYISNFTIEYTYNVFITWILPLNLYDVIPILILVSILPILLAGYNKKLFLPTLFLSLIVLFMTAMLPFWVISINSFILGTLTLIKMKDE